MTVAADGFLDTNILLYLLSADAGKADRAEALLAAGGTVSVQVLNELTAVARRKLALEFAAIREILATVRATCRVVSVDVETHALALDLAERRGFQIYDATIAAAALRAGCGVLYTEDLQHGQRLREAGHTLTIRNPFLAG